MLREQKDEKENVFIFGRKFLSVMQMKFKFLKVTYWCQTVWKKTDRICYVIVVSFDLPMLAAFKRETKGIDTFCNIFALLYIHVAFFPL